MGRYRITFVCEVYVEGDTLGKAKEKFEKMGLFADEAMENGAEFIDISVVERADDYKDVTSEWEEA